MHVHMQAISFTFGPPRNSMANTPAAVYRSAKLISGCACLTCSKLEKKIKKQEH